MPVVKTQKKVAAKPRKAATKKKLKKGSIKAIEESVKIAKKYNLDFNYIKE